jgi:type IV pilus assembly protein PilC
MIFLYKALKDNKQVTGKIDANNTEEAVSLLKAGGFFPIEVKKEGTGTSVIAEIFDRVDFTDVVNFTRQLSIMLNAGVTLIDAFDIFKKQSTKPSFMKMIEQMDKEIRGGKTFSETLKSYPHLFSNLYISLVKAGEASGKLNDILLSLSQTLEKQRELKGRVTGAFIYPALILFIK